MGRGRMSFSFGSRTTTAFSFSPLFPFLHFFLSDDPAVADFHRSDLLARNKKPDNIVNIRGVAQPG